MKYSKLDSFTGRKLSDNYVSIYSYDVHMNPKLSSEEKYSEDLAESIRLYLSPNKKWFIDKFPNRAKFIKKVLGDIK